MKSYFNQTPNCLIRDQHSDPVPVMSLRMTRHAVLVRILALCVLLMAVSLSRPVPTLAQDSCQEVNELMTFDYRSWGIGIHRSCTNCEVYDLPCHAEWAFCQTMKAKQITFGAPVAAWINESRAAAYNDGVSLMPAHIRNELSPLYPVSILDKVRYKTGSGFLGSLQWFRDEMGQKGAITLVDVIVFTDSGRAADVQLWAHELEHVRQYDQLGIDGFAQAYVDQTCILPGDNALGGYNSGSCKIERQAVKKALYYNKPDLVTCCVARNFPVTLNLHDRVLNAAEDFAARESITVGPNVVLQNGGNVTLRAGRVITMSPGFKTEPGGKLFATIDPKLNQACPQP